MTMNKRHGSEITWYDHQVKALRIINNKPNCAFYLDMGLGKTFVGAEQLVRYNTMKNLVVCQISKIADWTNHFNTYYPQYKVVNLRKTKLNINVTEPTIFIVNYESVWRKRNNDLRELTDFTLLLDESSLIQNDKAKVTKFILSLHSSHNILLSGTPVSGKYERLWSQMQLLGYDISKTSYNQQYVISEKAKNYQTGFYYTKVLGYKNEDRLKRKLTNYGAVFMKTEEVTDLPEQIDIPVEYEPDSQFKKFKRDKVLVTRDKEYVGDSAMAYRIYQKVLLANSKKNALRDILDSTNDRIVIFYNYNEELKVIEETLGDRPYGVVNGSQKSTDKFKHYNNGVLLVQSRAGAKGGNYQIANKMILFSPMESAEDYMQARKRIHRIGQSSNCFYYEFVGKGSIEEDIYKAIRKGVDYIDYLFEED